MHVKDMFSLIVMWFIACWLLSWSANCNVGCKISEVCLI